MSLKDIPLGSLEQFNVVIEIPDGSRNKYEYDPKTDEMKVSFVFSEAFSWPYNYGFVPQTIGGDGDALDAIVFFAKPFEVGEVVLTRTVGMVELLDRGVVDNKLLTIPVSDHSQDGYQDVDDLPEEYILRLEQLFVDLADEKNKTIEVLGFRDKARALEELKKSRLG